MLRWLALAALIALVAAGCVSAADAQQYDSNKAFNLTAGNTKHEGIWSNGDTMWVVDDGGGSNNKLFAYHINGTRDSNKDFGLHTGNSNPNGIWANRTTMLVVDGTANKIFAYHINGTRDSNKDFGLHTGNTNPYGIGLTATPCGCLTLSLTRSSPTT